MALGALPHQTIGSAIRTRRRQGNLSQGKLGRLVGKSQQWISAVENDRYLPSIELMRQVADHLGCDLADLYPPLVSRRAS
jgi:transcriptional regulator with XRE-family HTH domain